MSLVNPIEISRSTFRTGYSIGSGGLQSIDTLTIDKTSAYTGASTQIVINIPDSSSKSAVYDLLAFKTKYSLNNSQLSKILGVSRPTVYSWLKEPIAEATPMRPSNVENLSYVIDFLGDNIKPELGMYLGKLLSKTTNPVTKKFWNMISTETELQASISEGLFDSINSRLYGIKKVSSLSKSLEDKKPLI